jgi:hypothetical protein
LTHAAVVGDHVQARSFHEGLPFGALDALAYTMFKAEVLDAVKKKASSLTNNSFSMMVVEELTAQTTTAAAASGVGGGLRGDLFSSSSTGSGNGLVSLEEEAAGQGVSDFAEALATARNNRANELARSSSSSSRDTYEGEGVDGGHGGGWNHEWIPGGKGSSSSSTSSSDATAATSSSSSSGAGTCPIAGVIEVSVQVSMGKV